MGMATTPAGPGKTSPKLLADFIAFDPLASGRANILADPAPVQRDGDSAATLPNACKHEYIIKPEQSSLPPLDDRATEHTRYKIAVTCKKCRIHADIAIDYGNSSHPCPSSDYPLHHFQRTPSLDAQSAAELVTAWQCSNAACTAALTITHKIQRLSKDAVFSLTDTARLQQRYEEVVQLHPEREGIRQTTPIEAVTRLRKYIKDSLNPEHNKRTFPAVNKRFMEAFGVRGRDCRPLLEELGFVYTEQEETWSLPDPTNQDNGALRRQQLQDVEVELLALADRLSKELNAINPAAGEPLTLAGRDLERVLAAQGYHRYVSSLRGPTAASLEPYFASLGALSTFADSLIAFCFDRQFLCDVQQQPYYYECLKEIGSSRNSEDLHVKTSILASQGYYSRRELLEAYHYFGLSQDADELRIMNIYQARQSDLSSAEAERAREMLYKIGTSCGSRLLMNTAQQKIETVDEALAWLGNGVDKDTTDEALLNVLAVRVDSDKAKEEIARKAIEIIARDRHSQQLKTWLDTGRTDGYTMSVDEALRHIDITEPLDKVDATLWPAIFENARTTRDDAQTQKAIETIQHALAGISEGHAADKWPVGLTSLGNTCYLNSLLQYYFSIKPLRDIVLDYDKYKFDLSVMPEKTERVGQRQISPLEVKGGQKFAEDLRHLFSRMISDPSSAVKPEQDLVCRAFLDPKDSDLWDNKDKQSDDQPTKDIKSEPEQMSIDVDQGQAPQNSTDVVPASPVLGRQESYDLIQLDDNDVKPPLSTTAPAETALMTPPASPQARPMSPVQLPPPLPLRKFSTTTNAALERAQSNATQQQDVTEVHDGIQFRLRAGLRADGRDANGEQIDDLLELFSIHLAETTVKDGTSLKPQALTDSAIQLNVPSTPTDIYAALDAIFDQQPVEGSDHLERYKSITRLPPFLQINIPRVGFDKDKGEQFKSEHSIKLVDELYLDRYHSHPDDALLQRRKHAWEWRRQLAELCREQEGLATKPSGLTGPAALAETADFIESLDSTNADLNELGIEGIDHDPEVVSALKELADVKATRSSLLTAEIAKLQRQIDDTFEHLRDIKYRLQAVFFHRGKTAHGHYWICIRDFSTGMWRRYNDERVEEMPESKWHEIYEANEWAHGTPTYAVYVRDDIKLDVVQPVCRQLEELKLVEPVTTAEPTEMATAEIAA